MSPTRAVVTSASLAFLFTAQLALAADPPGPAAPARPSDGPDDKAQDRANKASERKEATDNKVAEAKSGDRAVVNGESLTGYTGRNGPALRFGQQEQLAFSSDEALTISSTTQNGVSGSVTNIQFQPGIDWFVIDNLSIGGVMQFNYTSAGAGHASTFGAGPRVGYNVPFSDLLSLWPKVGMSIDSTSTTTSTPAGSTSASSTSVALNLFVPLMFHPAPHFFVGFGPFLDADLSGTPQATTWGAKLTLGGWIGF